MRKSVVRKIVLWLILLGLYVAGMGLWVRSQVPQRCRLPGGVILTLRGWSYGKEAVLTQRADPWWNIFAPPVKIRFSQEPQTESLFLWINGAPIERRQAGVGSPVEELCWWDRVEVADETGLAITSVNGKLHGLPGTNGYSLQNVIEQGPMGYGYVCMQIRAFPRRGKRVIVRFYSNQQTKPIAEFFVPNPTPGPFPKVKPDPLPITRREGSLEGTLTRIELSKTHRYINGRGATTYSELPVKDFYRDPGEQEKLQAEFRLRDRDNPHVQWKMKGLVLADATGNRYDTSSLDYGTNANTATVDFYDPYSKEPLLMRVEFCRDAESEFAASELWTIPSIAVPHANTVTRSLAKWSQDGVTIEFLGLTGTGSTKLDPASPGLGLTSDMPAVWLRVTPAQSPIALMLRGKDNQGHEISPHRWIDNSIVSDENSTLTNYNFKTQSGAMQGLATSRKYSETAFFFHTPPGAKTLDLTFAINKSRFLEFTPVLLPASPGK